MITLAFDTALGSCSVALGDGQTLLAARYEEREAGQAERLIPLMEETLAEAGLAARQIARIGVTIGPGSFTGTRIGLAAARAMGVSLGIPVIGLTTLEALSDTAPADRDVMVAFDARRGQLYVQMFSLQMNGAREALSEPATLDVEQAATLLHAHDRPITLLGSGAEALAPHGPAGACILMPARFPIAAAFLARIARAAPGPGMPRPLYLRPADTT